MPNDSLVPTPEPETQEAITPEAATETPGEASPAADSDRPSWLPEKFTTPEALATSYGELERAFHGKRDDIAAEVRQEIAAEIPEGVPETAEGYVVPETIEITDPEAFAKSDIATWWRDTCHAAKLPQEAYEQGLQAYATAIAGEQPDLNAERAALGENADARISAAGAWMQANAKDQSEYEALQRLTQTASGIAMLERMTNGQMVLPSDGGGDPVPTQEELTSMQNDERYWKAGSRDPNFIKQVDEAYARRYANT
jgi:hypothetical protein